MANSSTHDILATIIPFIAAFLFFMEIFKTFIGSLNLCCFTIGHFDSKEAIDRFFAFQGGTSLTIKNENCYRLYTMKELMKFLAIFIAFFGIGWWAVSILGKTGKFEFKTHNSNLYG